MIVLEIVREVHFPPLARAALVISFSRLPFISVPSALMSVKVSGIADRLRGYPQYHLIEPPIFPNWRSRSLHFVSPHHAAHSFATWAHVNGVSCFVAVMVVFPVLVDSV